MMWITPALVPGERRGGSLREAHGEDAASEVR